MGRKRTKASGKKDVKSASNACKFLVAKERAMEVAVLPGVSRNHELQPFDISKLSELQLTEFYQLDCFSWLQRPAMEHIIARLGPQDAQGFATQVKLRNENLLKHGYTQETIDQLDIYLPITDPSQIDPRTVVFSVEMELPWVAKNLPISGEIVRQVLKDSMARQNLVFLTLPILPIPIVLGNLVHIIFQTKFPAAIDSFQYLRHLFALMEMYSADTSAHTSAQIASILEQRAERRGQLDKSFFDLTTALQEEFKDACPSTDIVPDIYLVKLEVIMCEYTIYLVRDLEITVAQFLGEKFRDHPAIGVERELDPLTQKPIHYGIPDSFFGEGDVVGEQLLCAAFLEDKEKLGDGVKQNLYEQTLALGVERRLKLGIPDVRAKVLRESGLRLKNTDPKEPVLTESMYSTLEDLRELWEHVFNEMPFEETPYCRAELENVARAVALTHASEDTTAAAAAEMAPGAEPSSALIEIPPMYQPYAPTDVPELEAVLLAVPDFGMEE